MKRPIIMLMICAMGCAQRDEDNAQALTRRYEKTKEAARVLETAMRGQGGEVPSFEQCGLVENGARRVEEDAVLPQTLSERGARRLGAMRGFAQAELGLLSSPLVVSPAELQGSLESVEQELSALMDEGAILGHVAEAEVERVPGAVLCVQVLYYQALPAALTDGFNFEEDPYCTLECVEDATREVVQRCSENPSEFVTSPSETWQRIRGFLYGFCSDLFDEEGQCGAWRPDPEKEEDEAEEEE
ncbi:hypothetical protein HYW17_05335 [Candidatus Uhrbacteria bacterium]|nr:hypothetical protein [Candidatus Uhrbacteria bacterium]